MDVRSDGPLRVGSLIFRAGTGPYTLTVVAKATFDLTPGESPLVPDGGDAVTAQDVYWGNDTRQSLRFASDLVPFKRRPEMLVTGSAYTPSGRVMSSLVVRVAVAEIDKVIEVQGERFFDLRGALSEPATWTRMPLRWERAAGGPGTSNPVGMPTGPDAHPDQWGRILLPNLCPAWSSVSSPRDVVPTIGLGPIAPDWPERRIRLHRHAGVWDPRAQPVFLPDDIDAAFFNVAPADQQMATLTGDEAILLENLHAEHARLSTRLERITPVATLSIAGASRQIPMSCDTLWIDVDRGTATLLYRGHVQLGDPAQPGLVLVGLTGAHASIAIRGAIDHAEEIEAVTADELEEDDVIAVEDVESTVTLTGGAAPVAALLPFAPHRASQPDADALVETLVGAKAPTFGLPPPDPHPVAAPQVTQTVIQPPAPPPAALQAVAPSPLETGTFGERARGGAVTLAQQLHAKRAFIPAEAPPPVKVDEPFVPPPTPIQEPPAPPPLIGAVPVALERDDAPSTSDANTRLNTPAPPPEPEAEKPLPIEAFPLERCAQIAASLDARPGEDISVFEAEGLDPDTYKRLSDHWQSLVDKELLRRKNTLLRTQDIAYLSRLEQERGPIAASDYAKLAVAADTNDLAPALKRLSIPEAAWPRIRRVWIAQMAKDPKLATIVQSLMDQS